MTQTPQQPPAGWYPQGGQERWWDGNQWSDNVRPVQQPVLPPVQQPAYAVQPGYAPPYGAPTYPAYAPPTQKSHVVRNVLIVLGVVLLLVLGGCVAAVVVVGKKVDDTVNDQTPGGPNVPKTITPGTAFSVQDFDYAAGWRVAADSAGDATVEDLKLTNHRDEADFALVHIDLRQGSDVLATISCTLTSGARIAKGDTQTLSCSSADPLPASYDRVTINDDI